MVMYRLDVGRGEAYGRVDLYLILDSEYACVLNRRHWYASA